jgi:hypothetical protein
LVIPLELSCHHCIFVDWLRNGVDVFRMTQNRWRDSVDTHSVSFARRLFGSSNARILGLVKIPFKPLEHMRDSPRRSGFFYLIYARVNLTLPRLIGSMKWTGTQEIPEVVYQRSWLGVVFAVASIIAVGYVVGWIG